MDGFGQGNHQSNLMEEALRIYRANQQQQAAAEAAPVIEPMVNNNDNTGGLLWNMQQQLRMQAVEQHHQARLNQTPVPASPVAGAGFFASLLQQQQQQLQHSSLVPPVLVPQVQQQQQQQLPGINNLDAVRAEIINHWAMEEQAQRQRMLAALIQQRLQELEDERVQRERAAAVLVQYRLQELRNQLQNMATAANNGNEQSVGAGAVTADNYQFPNIPALAGLTAIAAGASDLSQRGVGSVTRHAAASVASFEVPQARSRTAAAPAPPPPVYEVTAVVPARDADRPSQIHFPNHRGQHHPNDHLSVISAASSASHHAGGVSADVNDDSPLSGSHRVMKCQPQVSNNKSQNKKEVPQKKASSNKHRPPKKAAVKKWGA